MVLMASSFVTPFWGVPIGIVAYFLLFNMGDKTKEKSKKRFKKHKVGHAFMPRNFIVCCEFR